MKYITTQINLSNGSLEILPVYTPEFSYGEDVYIRIVAGNISPTSISVSLSSSYHTEKVYLYEKKPSIWEARLDPSIFREIVSNNISFSLHVYADIDNARYEANTEEIFPMIGTSLGTYHNTEISDLYDKVNSIYAKIHRRV